MTQPPHGTYARYVSKAHKCRCSKCRKANTEYMREWRRRAGLAQRRAKAERRKKVT